MEQRFPGRVNELLRRAAEWYAQNDYPECAIDEALEIRDFRLAADWLNRMHRHLLENSLRETVVQWVAAIPEGILAAYPELERLRVVAPANPLTQREQDVLRQIAAGASNQEIAGRWLSALERSRST